MGFHSESLTIFSFGPQPGSSQLLGVLLRLFCEDQLPVHQVNSVEHSSIGVFIPSRIDSRMPGIESR